MTSTSSCSGTTVHILARAELTYFDAFKQKRLPISFGLVFLGTRRKSRTYLDTFAASRARAFVVVVVDPGFNQYPYVRALRQFARHEKPLQIFNESSKFDHVRSISILTLSSKHNLGVGLSYANARKSV